MRNVILFIALCFPFALFAQQERYIDDYWKQNRYSVFKVVTTDNVAYWTNKPLFNSSNVPASNMIFTLQNGGYTDKIKKLSIQFTKEISTADGKIKYVVPKIIPKELYMMEVSLCSNDFGRPIRFGPNHEPNFKIPATFLSLIQNKNNYGSGADYLFYHDLIPRGTNANWQGAYQKTGINSFTIYFNTEYINNKGYGLILHISGIYSKMPFVESRSLKYNIKLSVVNGFIEVYKIPEFGFYWIYEGNEHLCGNIATHCKKLFNEDGSPKDDKPNRPYNLIVNAISEALNTALYQLQVIPQPWAQPEAPLPQYFKK